MPQARKNLSPEEKQEIRSRNQSSHREARKKPVFRGKARDKKQRPKWSERSQEKPVSRRKTRAKKQKPK